VAEAVGVTLPVEDGLAAALERPPRAAAVDGGPG